MLTQDWNQFLAQPQMLFGMNTRTANTAELIQCNHLHMYFMHWWHEMISLQNDLIIRCGSDNYEEIYTQ